MSGRLLGIARHGRPKGPIETLDRVAVTLEAGVEGDHRGFARPGSRRRRQVTVLSRAGWDAAMAALGPGAAVLDWSMRRANLLVDGIDLPREPGATLVFEGGVVLEITGETTPCSRMDMIAPGLRAVLTPDWRGGVTTRVVTGGNLAIGDKVKVERA